MTPLLLLIFRAAPNAAVGTDLLFSFGTKMAGAGAHHRQAQVRWDIVRTLSSGSLSGVLTGLGVLVLRGEHSTTAQKLMTIAVAAMAASISKNWVCLVSDEHLSNLKQRRRKNRQHGPISEPLWRQIKLVADAEYVTVSLMNVDEEAACGGYWRGGHSCVEHRMMWADLMDKDGLEALFCFEAVRVYNKLNAMFDGLREDMPALRAILSRDLN